MADLVYEAKVQWIAVRLESDQSRILKEPPFSNLCQISKIRIGLSEFSKWLFWDAPRYLGNAILVVIGRGEHTNETTDRMMGYIAILIVLGILVGIIPWPLVTKYIRRLSELFFQ